METTCTIRTKSYDVPIADFPEDETAELSIEWAKAKGFDANITIGTEGTSSANGHLSINLADWRAMNAIIERDCAAQEGGAL